ncbi:MAG TPA: hypothetical protein VMD30_12000 [Tepidisphaeraceae bacterium]|nr:hypothetical protein [Tepidisphaeraceae bacterium]
MAIDQPSLQGECYRCGYDLRGIADDQACPECGLLAERSRRVTDELHNTRPKWLRSISLGVVLIIIAVLLLSPAWLRLQSGMFFGAWIFLDQRIFIVVSRTLIGLFLFCGVLLVARSEGYSPADQNDRRLRRWLRILAAIPLATACGAALLAYAWTVYRIYLGPLVLEADMLSLLSAIPCAVLPLLLFLHLRGVAHRARSAHLAEHCVIVGTGASLAIFCIAAMAFLVSESGGPVGTRAWEAVILAGVVFAWLFIIWSLYLLGRFAIAFHLAARQLRRKWRRDDRSAATV